MRLSRKHSSGWRRHFNGGGTLNVTNCTFTNNGADATGGGSAIGNGSLTTPAFSSVTVTNCTIAGNTALQGGGISTGAAMPGATTPLTVTNSTIVRNFSAGNAGGGIYSDSSVPVNVKSTIIALSTGARDVSGQFMSGGFNLIGRIDGSFGFTAATDLTGLDPKLDPSSLQDNGGPTQTIALLPNSPAIDKGTSNGLTGTLTTDQRGPGFARTVDYPTLANASGGDGTDIGAFELLTPFAVSRKTHGAVPLDIDLPLSGAAGIECRTGGMNGDHQIVTTFPFSRSRPDERKRDRGYRKYKQHERERRQRDDQSYRSSEWAENCRHARGRERRHQ